MVTSGAPETELYKVLEGLMNDKPGILNSGLTGGLLKDSFLVDHPRLIRCSRWS